MGNRSLPLHPHTRVPELNPLQDVAMESPGLRGLKFRDKRDKNNPPRDTKDQTLALARGGRGKSRRKRLRTPRSVLLRFPERLLLVQTGRGPDGAGGTRSGRSPETCVAAARDGPGPRRGNSLCGTSARRRNQNQDTLSIKNTDWDQLSSFWVRLEERHEPRAAGRARRQSPRGHGGWKSV